MVRKKPTPKSKKITPAKKRKKRVKGLGDSVALQLKNMGIEKSPKCDCAKRQKWLNKQFPY